VRKRLFPLLIALSALAVSGSAAFYSVYGLSKLFAGASFEVMVMAGSLEFAKLVIASLLYQYWDTINRVLRAYLSIACFILILITSGGIYGFLSGAYQSTANQSELLDKSLMILNQKQVRFEEQKGDLKIEKSVLTKSISDLRIALSNPAQVQYIDKESGTLITTSSSSARRALQSELVSATTNRNNINIKMEAIMDSINKTDMNLLDKEVSNEAESELGPLKYLAATTGQDMGVVVNYFLLLIICVFDPLAIALVIAANMAFAQLKKDDTEVSMLGDVKSNTTSNDWPTPSTELKERVSINQLRMHDQEYSEDNWNTSVAKISNPGSLVEKVEIENKDVIVDNLEDLHKGQKIARGLDTIIEVLEQESLVDSNQSDEHELYHGSQAADVNNNTHNIKVSTPVGGRKVIKRKVRKQVKSSKGGGKGYGYSG
tara:strand:+ start:805 stop:2097 length:1293 start_codon:yes stop_codon:yes gene_type:complete